MFWFPHMIFFLMLYHDELQNIYICVCVYIYIYIYIYMKVNPHDPSFIHFSALKTPASCNNHILKWISILIYIQLMSFFFFSLFQMTLPQKSSPRLFQKSI